MPFWPSARSSAGAKSSVFSTVSAHPPNARASAAKSGLRQLGARDPLRIFALLVHADGAVGAVVDDDDEQVGAVLRGGRQLLAVHQEIAVAGDANDRAVPEADRGSDRGGQAIPHRPRCRRELGRHAAVAPVAVPPAREIAGAVADDRVFRELLAHCRDAWAEVELHAFARLRLRPFQPFRVRLFARRKSAPGRGPASRRSSRRTRPCPRRSAGRRGRRGRVRSGRGGRGPKSGRDGRA